MATPPALTTNASRCFAKCMAGTQPSGRAKPPGEREGRNVVFTENRALISEAIRRGWIKSLKRMDELLDGAIDDVEQYASSAACDRVELARLSVALSRTGAMVAGVHAKSVQITEGQQPAVVNNNTQVNIGCTQPVPTALQSDNGRDALARLRDAIQDSDAAAAGTTADLPAIVRKHITAAMIEEAANAA